MRKKMGATEHVTPMENLSYGRRGETQFRTKFFCLLFFQEKKVGATEHVTPIENPTYGRRSKAKLCTKFFAKLSFKKAGLLFFQEK